MGIVNLKGNMKICYIFQYIENLHFGLEMTNLACRGNLVILTLEGGNYVKLHYWKLKNEI